MLDPMAALGVAGNVVQFVDFSIKLVGKAHDIYKSTDGSLPENLDAEKVAETIRVLQSKLKIDENHYPSYDNETEGLLEGLCSSCNETANELLEILGGLKMQGKKTTWKSMRQAIKSFKGKATVSEILGRLEHFRELLEMTILVELRYINEYILDKTVLMTVGRKKVDLQLIANSDNFKTLETSTQKLIVAVLENRSVFAAVIETQIAELKEVHQKEASISAVRHENVKAAIVATVTSTSQQQAREHETTRQEIAQRAANEAAQLKVRMDKHTDEIKHLIRATSQSNGRNERKRLKEKTNAAAASLVAMDLIYESLMVCVILDARELC
jgi:hypothetical protein